MRQFVSDCFAWIAQLVFSDLSAEKFGQYCNPTPCRIGVANDVWITESEESDLLLDKDDTVLFSMTNGLDTVYLLYVCYQKQLACFGKER